MQRLYRFVLAYVTIWDQFPLLQEYHAACVSIFASICNDMGSVVFLRDDRNAAVVSIVASTYNNLGLGTSCPSSRITVVQRLY